MLSNLFFFQLNMMVHTSNDDERKKTSDKKNLFLRTKCREYFQGWFDIWMKFCTEQHDHNKSQLTELLITNEVKLKLKLSDEIA
jgi:hypothetical protein